MAARNSTFAICSIPQLCIPRAKTVPDLDKQAIGDIADAAEMYLQHYFDLLGSGWTEVRHGLIGRGVEGYAYDGGPPVTADRDGKWLLTRINSSNATESRRIWSFVDHGYQPIDWQVDFKSGYRWSERRWYKDVKVAPKPGVDIKVPWELARSQHLPQLALACLCARGAAHYSAEFRNQVLDFMATNPPQFGVNWACSMDVGLRIVNWIIAYSLFDNFGVRFDAEFDRLFSRSVFDHGRFLADNLEWNRQFRSNHYLANLLGLIFVSAYLEQSRETDVWLAFAMAELVKETLLQFNADGGNFEGSLSYHCLSAEMVVLAVAVILGIDEERLKGLPRKQLNLSGVHALPLEDCLVDAPFPAVFRDRLSRAIHFVTTLSSDNGHLPLVGDHDSGRALKLLPAYTRLSVQDAVDRFANLSNYESVGHSYLLERNQAVGDLVKQANALHGKAQNEAWAWSVRLLTRGRIITESEAQVSAHYETTTIGNWHALCGLWENAFLKRIVNFPLAEDLGNDVVAVGYPDSGFYLFRSKRLYLLIRCGDVGQNGVGGHSHLDQLSIDLWVDGQNLIRDPGTYLYTADPEIRNRYRSAAAHYGPSLRSVDRYYLSKGLFRLAKGLKGECLFFEQRRFAGRVRQMKAYVYRTIEVTNSALLIRDWTSARGYSWEEYRPLPVSPAYGWMESKAPSLTIGIDKLPAFETPLSPR